MRCEGRVLDCAVEGLLLAVDVDGVGFDLVVIPLNVRGDMLFLGKIVAACMLDRLFDDGLGERGDEDARLAGVQMLLGGFLGFAMCLTHFFTASALAALVLDGGGLAPRPRVFFALLRWVGGSIPSSGMSSALKPASH